MVQLKTPETISTKEGPTPVMHRHNLKCIKSAPGFPEGTTGYFFIARYDNDRYCVFTASFISINNYHVFDSEQDLHDHFEEI